MRDEHIEPDRNRTVGDKEDSGLLVVHGKARRLEEKIPPSTAGKGNRARRPQFNTMRTFFCGPGRDNPMTARVPSADAP